MAPAFVREARASDAPGLARIQVESWRSSLAGLVPDEVLAQLGSAEASERFTERWRNAIANPPTSKHKVHVAVDTDSGSGADPGGGTASPPGAGTADLPGAGTSGPPGAGTASPPGAGTAGPPGAGTAGLPPVGFASAGPATDEDKWPGTDGELYELHVLPSAGEGHGARLLHAVADTLAEDGFRTACTWALSGDSPRLEFLETAGWAPDGVHSNLDMGVKVPVVRLHTTLLSRHTGVIPAYRLAHREHLDSEHPDSASPARRGQLPEPAGIPRPRIYGGSEHVACHFLVLHAPKSDTRTRPGPPGAGAGAPGSG